MRRLSKRAAELQGTSALQAVQNLGVQVKGLLDSITPVMQGLEKSVPEINGALQQIKQLETQVGQLEQMKSKMQQVNQQAPTQQADDAKSNTFSDRMKEWAEKGWSKIVKTLGPGEQKDNTDENAIIGVRGEVPLPGVVKVSKEDKLPKDKLPGGEADNISEEKLDKKQLDMGQKVEMEHTDDPEIAREIARDHLSEELKDGKEKEDQEYYTKLKKVHEDKCTDSVPAFWRRNLDYGSQ